MHSATRIPLPPQTPFNLQRFQASPFDDARTDAVPSTSPGRDMDSAPVTSHTTPFGVGKDVLNHSGPRALRRGDVIYAS